MKGKNLRVNHQKIGVVEKYYCREDLNNFCRSKGTIMATFAFYTKQKISIRH